MGISISGVFAAVVVAAALGVTVTVAVVNWAIDSEGMFHKKFAENEAVAAEILRSPTGAIFNGNMRRLKLALTEQTDADCYISGSSRTMGFNAENWGAPADYGCRKIYNAGVYYGAYEDFVMLAATLIDKPEAKVVFVGFDPWIVHQRNKNGLFRTMKAVHMQARKRLGLPDGKYIDLQPGPGVYSQLIDPSYFVRNVRMLQLEWNTNNSGLRVRFMAVKPDYSNVLSFHEVIRQDGSRLRARNNVELLLKQGPYSDGSVLGKPNVNVEVVNEFKEVVRRLQASDKRVVFLLTPYSPEVWECLPGNAATCAALIEVEALARDLAREMGIGVYGSYDARKLGVETSEFLDGQHIRDEANRKITRTSGAD